MADRESLDTQDEQFDQGPHDVDSSGAIPPPDTDDKTALSDGRSLGYAAYGPPEGDPLLFCHGTPGSRYTRHPDTSLLHDHGIRQVTLERPGYGRSDFQAGRELLDWPADVQEVADALGFDRFAIAGISGGGPHALACAARIPDRLTNVVILNGSGPPDAPRATEGMALRNRLSIVLGKFPLIPRLQAWLVARQVRKDPDAAIDAIGDSFADVDAKVLQRPDIRAMLRQDLAEAFRQGTRGWRRDGKIITRTWGFDLDEVTVDVDLWHGELDTNAPVTMGRYVAENLPSCSARIYPEEGHLLIADYWDEILSVLTE